MQTKYVAVIMVVALLLGGAALLFQKNLLDKHCAEKTAIFDGWAQDWGGEIDSLNIALREQRIATLTMKAQSLQLAVAYTEMPKPIEVLQWPFVTIQLPGWVYPFADSISFTNAWDDGTKVLYVHRTGGGVERFRLMLSPQFMGVVISGSIMNDLLR